MRTSLLSFLESSWFPPLLWIPATSEMGQMLFRDYLSICSEYGTTSVLFEAIMVIRV